MTSNIVETTFLEQDAVHVRLGNLSVTLVPRWGSNLISLKFNDVDLFRVPQTVDQFIASPVLYGMPVLFPPNRIEGGTFTFNGRTYCFDINETKLHNHLHGFLHTRPWRLLSAHYQRDVVVLKTQFDSSQHSDVLRQFPHLFLVEMTFHIYKNTVRTRTEITNQDSTPFPWGLGYHTTFNFPLSGDSIPNQSRLYLSAYKQWELNHNLIPTGVLLDIPFSKKMEGGLDLTDTPLDDVFLSSVTRSGRNEAVLHDLNTGMKVIYRADSNFLHWVVYNADAKQGFLSLEPYTWVTNAPNVPQPKSLTGFRVLSPGESVFVETEIEVQI